MSDLTGARAEFVKRAREELERVLLLPVDQRDEAWSEAYGGGAIRNLANLPEFERDWMEPPSNASVSLSYLKRNPAPTLFQLDIQYELDIDGGLLFMQVAGVKGGDESQFRVQALLAGRDPGTILLWVGVKKTVVAGTSQQRVSEGRVSARGTAKTKVVGPEIGSSVVLRGVDRPDVVVRIVDYNLKRGMMWVTSEDSLM